jgi:hypothetical protein
MIKLFRNIRKNLLNEGKTSKYFKYAIGEIVLVVIGILIALQVSNWNQNRIKIAQEHDDLENLKEELQNNIVEFTSLDSLYATFERSSAEGLKMFNNNPNVPDLIKIDSLIVTLLKVFPLTTSTYDEMLNTGKFYNLKNKTLKTNITEFYAQANNYSVAFIEINKEVLKMLNHPNLYTYELLLSKLKTEPTNLKDIDTTWVHNVNSPTYLAFYKKANYIQEYSNEARRDLMTSQIVVCKELIGLIDEELENRK